MNKEKSNTKKKHYLKMLYIGFASLFILFSCTYATYAWFTHNRQVVGNQISVESGSEELTLEISNQANEGYSDVAEIFIDNNGVLNPVSTSDLMKFYKPISFNHEEESKFIEVENGFYSEELYLRTVANGFEPTDSVELYIDTDGIIIQDESSDLHKAIRIGLIISSQDTQQTIILGYDPVEETDRVISTLQSAEPMPVPDPARLMDEFVIKEEDGRTVLPDEYLVELPVNQVCKVEVFCYLEGNDKDCDNKLREQEIVIQFPFYAVLSRSGE